jgi:hypothetical protein
MSKKGCDASNIYDEEVPVEDQEHSDDEVEKEAKRALKKKKQLKRRADSDSSLEEGEEGEIKGNTVPYKRFNNQNPPSRGNQYHRGRGGSHHAATIPQYSTSVPLNYQQPN